jgi:hypothetical protein
LLGTSVTPEGRFIAQANNQVPLVVLICNTCYFVRQFALVPLLKEHGDV